MDFSWKFSVRLVWNIVQTSGNTDADIAVCIDCQCNVVLLKSVFCILDAHLRRWNCGYGRREQLECERISDQSREWVKVLPKSTVWMVGPSNKIASKSNTRLHVSYMRIVTTSKTRIFEYSEAINPVQRHNTRAHVRRTILWSDY